MQHQKQARDVGWSVIGKVTSNKLHTPGNVVTNSRRIFSHQIERVCVKSKCCDHRAKIQSKESIARSRPHRKCLIRHVTVLERLLWQQCRRPACLEFDSRNSKSKLYTTRTCHTTKIWTANVMFICLYSGFCAFDRTTGWTALTGGLHDDLSLINFASFDCS